MIFHADPVDKLTRSWGVAAHGIPLSLKSNSIEATIGCLVKRVISIGLSYGRYFILGTLRYAELDNCAVGLCKIGTRMPAQNMKKVVQG